MTEQEARELDLQVHLEVMGLPMGPRRRRSESHPWEPAGGIDERFRHYSTDRTAWLDVVARLEAMELEAMELDVYTRSFRMATKRWYTCTVKRYDEIGTSTVDTSMADAVCEAALQAARYIKEDRR